MRSKKASNQVASDKDEGYVCTRKTSQRPLNYMLFSSPRNDFRIFGSGLKMPSWMCSFASHRLAV